MAKLSNKIIRQLDGEEPRLTVRLDQLFKKPVPDEALRQRIAQSIIDRILDRTENATFMEKKGSGTGKKDSGALVYTDKYKSSFEFRVYKGTQSRVNLKATGDMLRAIDLLDSNEEDLYLGFDDQEEAKKAHGHITGSVGKTRDFFGLPEGEMQDIRRTYQDEVDALNRGIFEGEQRRQTEDNLAFLLRALQQQRTATDG